VADSPRIEELKRRVQSDPASIAFAALAEEYRRAGRFDEAIETCTAGLIRHPSYLSAHVTLGRALIEVGRLEDARNELEYVLRLAPENLAAIRGLAEIHDRLGEGSHAPNKTAKSQAHEPAAPEMTVAEIHAASGFSQTAVEEAEPALFFVPDPVEPEPVKPAMPHTGEPEPVTPLVPPTWGAEPATPPVPPPFDFAQGRPLDSRGTTARSGLPPWEVEPFAPPAPPMPEAEPATPAVPPTWEVEAFAPSVRPTFEAEPTPAYIPISMEEDPVPEVQPTVASVSHVQQAPADEPALAPFDFAQGGPFAPSTSSGSSRATSRDDSAQGKPGQSRATGLEEFLKAILRTRAKRGASR
jgi:hypothetical protein